MPKAIHVFTPNGIPEFSYVKRENLVYEDRLRNAVSVPNSVVSISGPSKSGKTVLIKKVIDPDCIIEMTGASIKTADDLWRGVLAWMGSPTTSQVVTSVGGEFGVSASAGGKAGIPFVAQGEVQGEISGSAALGQETTRVFAADLLAQVVKEIGGSEFTVFVDDFHYINRDLQTDVGRQIKAACEKGVRICVASVPHRSDDAVRANPELRGRLEAIDVKYWEEVDLRKIAEKGFAALNVGIEHEIIRRLAREAYGSPQLMQAICLQLCFRMKLDFDSDDFDDLDVSQKDVDETLQSTSSKSEFRSLVEGLHAGPKQRGTERKEFKLKDGSSGDVYRTLLVAIRQGQGTLSLSYDELLDRVRAVCISESPVGSSIQTSLEHMSKIAANYPPSVLEWDEDRLDIVDPYFLFYLRHSDVLSDLRKVR